MRRTSVCKLLDIEYPVIQAPMNWITCAELAAAVSNAAGLGVLGPTPGNQQKRATWWRRVSGYGAKSGK